MDFNITHYIVSPTGQHHAYTETVQADSRNEAEDQVHAQLQLDVENEEIVNGYVITSCGEKLWGRELGEDDDF